MLLSHLSPKRILIVRLGAIGDIVMASGLIHALSQRFPNATIDWLSEPATATMLNGHPLLEQVLTWPKAEWKQLLRQKQWKALTSTISAFRQTLKQQGYDLVLDIQGLLKSTLLSRMTGCSQIIGLNSREKSHWLTKHSVYAPHSQMMSSEYRYLAKQLGCKDEDFIYSLPCSTQDKAKVALLLNSHNISSHFIALAPFTTRPQKHWPQQHWQTLIQCLKKHAPYPIVILGGPNDRQSATALVGMSENVISLAGECSLSQSAEVIRRARLLIGVDTGLTHMGTVFSRPTLALFGSTMPYNATPVASTKVLSLNLTCSPCRRHPTCNQAYQCLRDLTPSWVLQEAIHLMDEHA